MPTDFDNDGSGSDLGADDPSDKNSDIRAKLTELNKRLSGQTRTVDRLTKENNTLRAQVEGRAETEETEASQLRVQNSDLKKQLADEARDKKLALDAQAAATALAARLQARDDAAKVIAAKHPSLLDDFLIGDLKLRSDFESDEAFDAYLVRQAAKTAPPETQTETPAAPAAANPANLAQTMRGATPSGVTRVVDIGGTKPRDRNEIAADMMDLDPTRFPAHAEAYERLVEELRQSTNS